MADLERELQRAARARADAVAAIERSLALAEEHARRAEALGDQARAEREREVVARAQELLARLRSESTEAWC
jgi:hypothetical protein